MKKTNWLRICIFIVLLFSLWLLGAVGVNSIWLQIYASIVFLPFVLLSKGGLNLDTLGLGMILGIVWAYFIAIILEKIYTFFLRKFKNKIN